jgi:transposase
MKKASIIGLDLAKRSFQAHGALADGSVAFRKKLTREKVLGFFAEQPRCIVAMEACGSAHHCSAPTPNDSFGDANGRRSDFEV